MVLIKNKKGFFFTIIIMVLMSMLLFSSAFFAKAQYRESLQKRVSTMNNYLVSTEADIERQMYVTGYRIIFLIEKRILDTGAYTPNLESIFEEAFFNGTINQEPQGLVLEGATYYDFLEHSQMNAKRINIELNITSPKINLTQEDPWRIAVILTANLTMKDSSNLASWNKSLLIKTYIPIDRFEDPVYIIKTNGKISITPIKSPYSFPENNVENLSLHIAGFYYVPSTEAPSFIDRLKGNITATSPYGIESLININEFNEKYISIINRPIIDHIYFSDAPTGTACTPSGLPSWVIINQEHKLLYNVTSCT